MRFVRIKINPRSGWFSTTLFMLSTLVVAPLNAAEHRAVQLTPGGLLTSFSDFGEAVSTAGDVNNDGYDDIIIGRPNAVTVYVYYGSNTGQFSSPSGSVGVPDWQDTVNASEFGSAIAAGDFNCDNIDDVAVGAYDSAVGQFREGHVYVYYGSNTGLSDTPDWRAESDTANAWFGWSVSNAGDVNNDGCNDLLVGGRRSGSGSATLILGGDGAGGTAPLPDGDGDGIARPSDFSWQVTGTGDLGQSVAGVGDVNNDTIDDILVGSRNGNIYLYYGVAAGVPDTTANWSDTGFSTFGRTVARAGDVNGDTIADFIIGQPVGNGGRVHLYFGATGGPRTDGSPDWSSDNVTQTFSYGSDLGFASSISPAGNLNGDAYDDFIVGWPGYDGSLARRGQVHIYYGGASGPASSAPDQTMDGAQEGDQFGASVSVAGKVDGDLVDDFVVGAPGYSSALGSTTSSVGTAFAYLSSAAPPHITINPPQSYTNVHITSEDGTTKTSFFTVVLDTLPGADVTVTITSNDATEGAVSPAVLTFTSGNWDIPQTVNISGVDDALDDSDVQYTISFAVSSTGDSDYNGLLVDDVTVTNEDDDAIDIIVNPIVELVTTEDLGTATFTVVLDAQPTDNVTIALASSDTSEGTVSPPSVTFDTVNFRDPQLVTVTGVEDDGTIDGNILYTIITAPAVSVGDPRYNGLDAADVSVTNHDNDLKTSAITIEGNQIGSLFGRSVNRAGDINRDGFADFIVGAPKYDNGESNEGRVYVYFGAATGFSPTPWSAEVDQANAEFGWSVAGAGDVNGDGFDDIIIGARKYNGGESNEGRVFVYYGSATGLPAVPDWAAEIDQADANFGAAVSSAGDINGDGFDDILVGADNYYAADYVSSGAGFPQFVKEGAAFLFYGSASGLPDSVADGVARLSDGDVAWQGETGGSNGLYSANYGRTVAAAGDVNCDGYADIVIGAPKYSLFAFNGLWGRVWVYHGGPGGLRSDGNADWTMLGPQASSSFGSSVSSAGNVNGDLNGSYSCDDIIIGADSYESTTFPVSENNEGRVYLYYGSPTGLTDTPWTHENNQADSKLGVASAGVGDINNDGFADVIASANRYDGGETDEGRLYIYFGSASGLSNPVTREIDQAFAFFGTAVAGTGDVDGDGEDDFIVGTTAYDGDLFNEGAAILYLSDKPAVKVFPTSGLVTSEAGGSANFSVVLTATPTANVTIALSSGSAEGILSSASLVFTPEAWFTPQIVTITGVDDGVVDGNVPYTIITAAAVSGDERYSGMTIDDVAVINLDNESPTVTVTASDGVASESGPDSGTFTVSRTGGTPSSLPVSYTLSGVAANGLDYQSLSGSVTIAAGSASAAITLTPLLDGFFEPDETVILTLSADIGYTLGGATSANITISDGTANGITISPSSGLITTEQAGSATFSVVLTSLPTADVTINLASDTPAEGSSLVASVTFTTADWNTPQAVTVVGQNDAVVDGDVPYNIVTSVTSGDSNYSALNPVDVAVTNRDDDALSVVSIMTRTATVNEGTAIVFRISRSGNTASNLNVNYTVSGTATNGLDYNGLAGSATILGGQSSRDILVFSISDIDPEADETVILSLSDDPAYIVGSPRADTATIGRADILASSPVNFGLDQIVTEGATINVPVVKGAENYSTVVAYTVSGSATNPADHNAVDDNITLSWSETSDDITFSTVADGDAESDETVIFTLQSLSQGVLGNKRTHTVTITEANLQPAMTLAATQSGLQTRLVVVSSGNVTLTAQVADPNPGDSHTYDWSLSNINLVDIPESPSDDPTTRIFDPSGLVPGFYKARVTITDSGGLVVTNELLLEVVATAPTLGFSDTDDDGINNSTESYDDSDNDGIPDYLDPNNNNAILARSLSLNALQQLPLQYSSYVMRADPGLALRLGNIAFAAGNNAAQVTVEDIANFGDGEGGAGSASAQDIIPNVGGYFDFKIANLPVAGASARVVIPQFEPLPNGARYRKFHPVNGWNDFVEDASNELASAPGIPGQCPLPGDAGYTPGLTPGNRCVQLTIEDGGPNDTDGIANHVIEDPGQIGTVIPTVTITVNDAVASESGLDTGSFTLLRSGDNSASLQLQYLVSGSAINGVDYQNLSGSVTIAAGSSSAIITITPVPDGLPEASETVTLTLSVDAAYTVGISASASVTMSDDIAAGIMITPSSGLVTTEQGGSDTFNIVLTSQPTADVVINLASDTLSEGLSQVSSLTFTADNWSTSQTVTVVGQDDSVVDGDVNYMIVTTVSSSDSNYGALNPADVAVTNLNDDALPVVSVIASDGMASEMGDTGTFTFSRTGGTLSSLLLVYTISGSADSGIDYQSLSGSVTLAAGSSSATITVIPLADGLLEAGETVILTLDSVATYTVGTPDSATITISDGTAAGIMVTPTSGLVTTEAGDSDTFSIVLTGQPTADVVINLASDTPSEGLSQVNSLTFTADNWSTAQIVTVVGQDDSVVDGDVSYTIVTTVNSSDSNYSALNPADVTVTNLSKDSAAVDPLPVRFAPDQWGAEGAIITVSVIRNSVGEDLTVTYTVSGTALNPDDHDAIGGTVFIPAAQNSAEITFNTVADVLPEGDETVIFTIQGATLPGIPAEETTHTVTITEVNLTPATALMATQNGLRTHLVVVSGGSVTLTADVTDPNPGDSHTYDWSLSNNSLVDDDLDGDPATFVFAPSGLAPGFYKARVTVTDDGISALAVANELLFEVVAMAPILGFEDSDGDASDDFTESYDDSDGDGISDYLDPATLMLNALQQLPVDGQNYVMRTDPGLALRLGDIAFVASGQAARVTADDIASFGDGEGAPGINAVQDTFPNSGGYIDFEITNLPIAGASASVLIPRAEALPSGAQYRQYHPITGWNDFVEDTKNVLASAPGTPGICPMLGDVAYTPGLTPGHFCVQLTIEDGGPNDSDGLANHVIENPGQIAIVVALSTLSISATDAEASEAGPNSGTFILSRTGGDIDSPLTVLYAVTGTASMGDDYASLSGSVTFAAGDSSTAITITPRQDGLAEASESVILTLSADAAYTVGPANSARITIKDGSQPSSGGGVINLVVILGLLMFCWIYLRRTKLRSNQQ